MMMMMMIIIIIIIIIVSTNTQILDFVKIRSVRTVLFRENGWTDRQTDRQTDMTKLIVAFRNSANASKKKVSHSTHASPPPPDRPFVIDPQ